MTRRILTVQETLVHRLVITDDPRTDAELLASDPDEWADACSEELAVEVTERILLDVVPDPEPTVWTMDGAWGAVPLANRATDELKRRRAALLAIPDATEQELGQADEHELVEIERLLAIRAEQAYHPEPEEPSSC